MSEVFSDSVSVDEQGRHLELYEDIINSDEFIGLHKRGLIEYPAIVLKLNSNLRRSLLAETSRRVYKKEEGHYMLFIQLNNTLAEYGRIDNNIRDIRRVRDGFRAYDVEIYEIIDSKTERKISLGDFIETLVIGEED